MPLQLGGVETMRSQVITWDPDKYEEVQDAISRIKELESRGFTTTSPSDGWQIGQVRLEPPKRNPNIGCFRIISDNGDDRVVWDRRIPEQVKEAFKKFKELLKKGYTAYATISDGSRGHKITEFDPGLEEIILGAGEAILVPKTAPG